VSVTIRLNGKFPETLVRTVTERLIEPDLLPRIPTIGPEIGLFEEGVIVKVLKSPSMSIKSNVTVTMTWPPSWLSKTEEGLNTILEIMGAEDEVNPPHPVKRTTQNKKIMNLLSNPIYIFKDK